jgi:hypothetical protein
VKNFRRFQELPPGERRLFIAAILLLPIARACLGIGGFNRTYRLITRVFPLRPATRHSCTAERCVKATMRIVGTAAAHGPCRANCLPRSLAALALLRRQGLDAQIRVGARKKAGAFEAHAWISVGTVSVDAYPDGDRPFVPFTELPQLNRAGSAVR